MNNNTWAITIRPPFVERIISGRKAYEVRTRLPRDFGEGDEVFVVSDGSGGKVVLSFRVRSVCVGAPIRMWEVFKRDLGISEDEFFLYTAGKEWVYLIRMEKVKRLDPSWTFADLRLSRAPQWFTRVKVCRRCPHSAALMPEKSAMSGR